MRPTSDISPKQIRPRLGRDARFLGPIGFARKRRLLTAARVLLIPSLVAETSSLVAMEALACGCPVVAFPAGALPDIVEPGVTGFLVSTTEEMAEAIPLCDGIDRERCRELATATIFAGCDDRGPISAFTDGSAPDRR